MGRTSVWKGFPNKRTMQKMLNPHFQARDFFTVLICRIRSGLAEKMNLHPLGRQQMHSAHGLWVVFMEARLGSRLALGFRW